MIFQRQIFQSPIGDLVLITHEDTVYVLDFVDDRQKMERKLQQRFPNFRWNNSISTQITKKLNAYFKGDLKAITGIAVEPGGSPFQKKVWRALQDISAGETNSYGKIALSIGSPGASRAVGTANSLNPIAIIIPCHRVIGSNGTLRGYAGGVERKRWLLAHESNFGSSKEFVGKFMGRQLAINFHRGSDFDTSLKKNFY